MAVVGLGLRGADELVRRLLVGRQNHARTLQGQTQTAPARRRQCDGILGIAVVVVVVVVMLVVVVVIVVVSYLGILRPVNHTQSPQEEPNFHGCSETRRNGSHQNTSKTKTTNQRQTGSHFCTKHNQQQAHLSHKSQQLAHLSIYISLNYN